MRLKCDADTNTGNTDDSSQSAPKYQNNTQDLVDSLITSWPNITTAVINQLLEYYPDVQARLCPYDTGDGVLVSGLYDKQSNAIYTDLQQFAPRRLLSETMAKANNSVYAWRYNQVSQNVTIDIGKVHFSVSRYHLQFSSSSY